MITIENLTKKFGEVTAVEGLTFNVDEGEVFGFLGPNGNIVLKWHLNARGLINVVRVLMVNLHSSTAICNEKRSTTR